MLIGNPKSQAPWSSKTDSEPPQVCQTSPNQVHSELSGARNPRESSHTQRLRAPQVGQRSVPHQGREGMATIHLIFRLKRSGIRGSLWIREEAWVHLWCLEEPLLGSKRRISEDRTLGRREETENYSAAIWVALRTYNNQFECKKSLL